MKFKKLFFITCIVIGLFTMASVCAGEIDDTPITAIDSQDNSEINEDNQVMEKTDDSVGADDSLNEPQEDSIENIKNEDKLGTTDDDLIGEDLKAEVIALNVSVVDNTMFVVDCSGDFNGKVSIRVGEDTLYDGGVKTIIKTAKLPAGNYVATALFYGDDKYANLTLNDIRFTVSRVTPLIEVSIDDVTYPNIAHAIVNIGNNANGTVNVTVGKRTFNGTVYNGCANVTIFGLAAGYKEAKVEFFSRDYYNNDVNALTKFIVYPNNSLIEVHYDTNVFNIGNDIEFYVNTLNSTGDLHAYINGVMYTGGSFDSFKNVYEFAVTCELEGTYIFNFRLDGDENYTGYETTTTFYVVKNDISIDVMDIDELIYVDRLVTFTAKLNNTVTGNVIFTINGVNYTEYVNNDDKVTHIYTPSNNDTLTVVATFMGNDMYNANESASKEFNVKRIDTNVDVDFYSPIIAGDDAIIRVSMYPDITCTAVLTVEGKSYDVAIVEGKGVYTVSNLADAIYNVKVTFEGDKRYAPSVSELKQLYVNKVLTNLSISIDKTSMSYHDFAVVSVVLNQSMNAVVTVKVNGANHTVGLVNGKGSLTLYDLDKANYTINAVFAGDDKYVGCTSDSLNLTVTGDNITSSVSVSLDAVTEFVGDDIVINVNTNPTVTGIVKLNIGSNSYEVAVNRGVGKLTVSDLPDGDYDIQAVFDGDNIHLNSSSEVSKLEVKKIPTSLSVSVDTPSVIVGDEAIVTVKSNLDMDCIVNLIVGSNCYGIVLTDGEGSLIVSNLVEGNYDVQAIFDGDNKYLSNSSEVAKLEVKKIPTELSVSVDNPSPFVGDSVVVGVTLNQHINNAVTVNVNGKDYVIGIVDGKGSLTLSDLAFGSYNIKATFAGSTAYEKSSKDVQFSVKKATPKIAAKTKTFKVKVKTKKYTVTLKDNAGKVIKSAKLTLKVKGKTYVAATDGKGKATFKINKLAKKGTYKAAISYGGNNKYNKVTVSAKIKVK